MSQNKASCMTVVGGIKGIQSEISRKGGLATAQISKSAAKKLKDGKSLNAKEKRTRDGHVNGGESTAKILKSAVKIFKDGKSLNAKEKRTREGSVAGGKSISKYSINRYWKIQGEDEEILLRDASANEVFRFVQKHFINGEKFASYGATVGRLNDFASKNKRE